MPAASPLPLRPVCRGGRQAHPPEQGWYVDDVLPPDSATAAALIEHRWAIGSEPRSATPEVQPLRRLCASLDPVVIGLLAAEDAKYPANR